MDVFIITGIASIVLDLVTAGRDGAAAFLIFFFAADPAIIFAFVILARPFVFLLSSPAAFLISLVYKVYCQVSIDNSLWTGQKYKPTTNKLFFQ